MSRSRKKVFSKRFTRAEFVSRETVSNHISGKCVCDHSSSEHYSAAFVDAPVKRCHATNCKCKQFRAKKFMNFKESEKSLQEQRSIKYRREFMNSNSCSSRAFKHGDRARSTSY